MFHFFFTIDLSLRLRRLSDVEIAYTMMTPRVFHADGAWHSMVARCAATEFSFTIIRHLFSAESATERSCIIIASDCVDATKNSESKRAARTKTMQKKKLAIAEFVHGPPSKSEQGGYTLPGHSCVAHISQIDSGWGTAEKKQRKNEICRPCRDHLTFYFPHFSENLLYVKSETHFFHEFNLERNFRVDDKVRFLSF